LPRGRAGGRLRRRFDRMIKLATGIALDLDGDLYDLWR
jgi:hypothetical protein